MPFYTPSLRKRYHKDSINYLNTKHFCKVFCEKIRKITPPLRVASVTHWYASIYKRIIFLAHDDNPNKLGLKLDKKAWKVQPNGAFTPPIPPMVRAIFLPKFGWNVDMFLAKKIRILLISLTLRTKIIVSFARCKEIVFLLHIGATRRVITH